MSKTAEPNLQNAPILLREDRAGGVCVVTLNRPAARNSLSRAMLQALEDMLADIAADTTCRVVVLAGAGTVFCAGHDLREITAHRADADGGRGFYADAMAACARVMQGIVGLPQPVIAAVRVPPSACRTSQSITMVFSPSSRTSMMARSERPISLEISCVLPPTFPFTASRSLRS